MDTISLNQAEYMIQILRNWPTDRTSLWSLREEKLTPDHYLGQSPDGKAMRSKDGEEELLNSRLGASWRLLGYLLTCGR